MLIRRKDGRTFALVPEKIASSPLDVPSIMANFTTQEIVDRLAVFVRWGHDLTRIEGAFLDPVTLAADRQGFHKKKSLISAVNIAILGLGNPADNVLAPALLQIEGARLRKVVSIKSIIIRAFRGGPHDETVIVSMQFESGATAEFCSSVLFESPFRDRNLFFYDFRLAIRINLLDTSSRKYRNDKAKRTAFPFPITLRPDPAAM